MDCEILRILVTVELVKEFLQECAVTLSISNVSITDFRFWRLLVKLIGIWVLCTLCFMVTCAVTVRLISLRFKLLVSLQFWLSVTLTTFHFREYSRNKNFLRLSCWLRHLHYGFRVPISRDSCVIPNFKKILFNVN